MGIFGSSEENIDQKTIDTNGQVNNNIVIQEAKDTHSQLLVNSKLLYATYALVGFEIIKLATYMFASYTKRMKKAFQKRNNANDDN